MLLWDISHKMTELPWEGATEHGQIGLNNFLITFDQYDCNSSTIADRDMGSLWEKCSLKLLCLKFESQGLNQETFFFFFGL